MITSFLFESVWRLIIALVVVQFLLIGLWSCRRSERTKHAVWAGFAGLVLLPALSIVIETAAESVERRITDLVAAVEQKDFDVIARSLAPELEAEGLSRDGLIERLQARLQNYRVTDARVHSMDVTFAADGTATAEFSAIARIRGPDLMYEWLPTRWRLQLRRAGDDWLVSRIQRLPHPGVNLNNLRDLVG